jgi:autoinducer 2-degrading protein
MSAIVLLVQLDLNPGQKDAFVARALENRRNVIGKEPGCLRFDLVLPDEGGDTVYLYEVYADDAALQTHFNTPYMKQYIADTAPMIAQRRRTQCTLAND